MLAKSGILVSPRKGIQKNEHVTLLVEWVVVRLWCPQPQLHRSHRCFRWDCHSLHDSLHLLKIRRWMTLQMQLLEDLEAAALGWANLRLKRLRGVQVSG